MCINYPDGGWRYLQPARVRHTPMERRRKKAIKQFQEDKKPTHVWIPAVAAVPRPSDRGQEFNSSPAETLVRRITGTSGISPDTKTDTTGDFKEWRRISKHGKAPSPLTSTLSLSLYPSLTICLSTLFFIFFFFFSGPLYAELCPFVAFRQNHPPHSLTPRTNLAES